MATGATQQQATRRRRSAQDDFDDRAPGEPAVMEAESTGEAASKTRRAGELPAEVHVGPASRDAGDAIRLRAKEGDPLEAAAEVEPRHAYGCPSDPEIVRERGDDPDEPGLRRVERYGTKTPEGAEVAIVRCIDCGAHVRIDPD